MPEAYTRPSRQSRAFICTPYVRGPGGQLVAEMPRCCPARACGGGVEGGCDLCIEYHRPRKTGPGHPLAVVRCRTDGLVFTLYPPGYAPYCRRPVLMLGHDGMATAREKDRDRERADFDGTFFEAAVDARHGVAWARESTVSVAAAPDRYWGTQGRHLHLAAHLTGVARDLCDRARESIAMVLSVDGLRLREGSRARGYREIGTAVCSVLAELKSGARRALDLLTCGALAGCWGEPLYWDAERQVLERAPFPIPGNDRHPPSHVFAQIAYENGTSARSGSRSTLRGP